MARHPKDGIADPAALVAENERLRLRLQESEETLRAIGNGEVDAFVVSGPDGDHIFTLKGADEPYRMLVEAMSEGAADLASDGTILYCNTRLASMLQMPLERLIGAQLGSFVAPEDRPALLSQLVNRTPDADTKEMALVRADGKTLDVLFSCGSIDPQGGSRIGVVFTDIRDLKKAQADLRKERTLLKELLHRVKNTLAQIGSLARLEADISGDPAVQDALGKIGGRISALSHLYAMLHSGSESEAVRLDLYLADIAWTIVAAMQATDGRVSLRLELDPLSIHQQRASSFGLALNELMTNAFKYAFPDGRSGEIVVSLRDRGDGILMEVANDGIGLPEGFEPSVAKGLGLGLVQNMAIQLDGEFRWARGRWTRFGLDVPKRPQ